MHKQVEVHDRVSLKSNHLHWLLCYDDEDDDDDDDDDNNNNNNFLLSHFTT